MRPSHTFLVVASLRETLLALRPWNADFGAPLPGLFLPPKQIVRAYQLVEHLTKPLGLNTYDATSEDNHIERFTDVIVPSTCLEFINAMATIRNTASKHDWVPLYHYTNPMLASSIAKTGFRMSTQGQGDGGVYFSMQGPSLYDLGSESYEDNIIIDCFGEGRLDEYRGKHKLDLVIVYGCDPRILSQAPGGRDNAKVVGKAAFEALSKADQEGNLFLRPDRILGMFLIDPLRPPAGAHVAKKFLAEERCQDNESMATLAKWSLEAASTEAELHKQLRRLAASRLTNGRVKEEADAAEDP